MSETINTAEYKVFTWTNPDPMPPCGKNCPFWDSWAEDK